MLARLKREIVKKKPGTAAPNTVPQTARQKTNILENCISIEVVVKSLVVGDCSPVHTNRIYKELSHSFGLLLVFMLTVAAKIILYGDRQIGRSLNGLSTLDLTFHSHHLKISNAANANCSLCNIDIEI